MTLVEARPEQQEEVAAPPAEPPAPPVRKQAAPPVRKQAFAARVVSRVLALLAVGVLGFAGYLLGLTRLEQDSNQDVLYSQLRGPIAEGVPPYAGHAGDEREVPPIYDDGEDELIPAGAPIAVLEIPRIGLRQVIVEGTSSGDLMLGPGHRRNSVLPGQRGISWVYGRATTFGGPFSEISSLRKGDTLTVVTFQGKFTFRVEGVRRDGDPKPDLGPLARGGSRLTLVTAGGDNPLQPEHTVFVDALLRGQAQPAAALPGVLPKEEHSLAVDRPALLPLVLWLQALAVLAVLGTWARLRWGRWETYLVAVPAGLGVVWQVYESLARLLPNLT